MVLFNIRGNADKITAIGDFMTFVFTRCLISDKRYKIWNGEINYEFSYVYFGYL